MNSQGKTSHNEYLESSNVALNEIMKTNNSSDSSLNKEENSIQDLARYLACPTSEKESMMIDDKGNMSDNSFSHTQQSLFDPVPDSMANMHCSDPSTTFSSASSMQTSDPTYSHPNDQQQFMSQSNSFGQTLSVYPEPVAGAGNSSNIIYSNNPPSTDAPSFDNISSQQASADQNHLQTLHSGPGNSIHFFQDGLNTHFQHGTSDLQFHSSLQPDYSDSSNRPFQDHSQNDTNNFQSNSMLSATYSSTNSQQGNYTNNQETLGFSMMDVNPSVLTNSTLDTAGQFKTPEKMHVDEPEGLYHHADNNSNNEYFQFKHNDIIPLEKDMQTYHTANCQQQPPEANHFISFTPSLQSSPSDYSLPGIPTNANNIGFESSSQIFPSASMTSSFDSNDYSANNSQHASTLQTSSQTFLSDFQVQQSPVLPNPSVDINYSSSLSAGVNETNSPEYAMQSSPSPNQPSFVPDNNNQAHDSQYQESSVKNLISPSSSKKATVIGENANDYSMLAHPNAEASQSMLSEQGQLQQNSLTNYRCDSPLLVNQPAISSVAVGNQEQAFINSSLSPATFINYSPTNDISLHQVQDLNCKTSRELNITEFSPSLSSTSSGLSNFHDDNDAFPHLDIEAVVAGNFAVDSNLSSLQHRSLSIDTTPQVGLFGDYSYQGNNQCISFSDTSLTVTNTSAQSTMDFVHQGQPQISKVSSGPFLQNTTHSTNPTDTHVLYHIQPNQYSPSKTKVDIHAHHDPDLYPQPMQVQEADLSKKFNESSSVFSFETLRGNAPSGGNLETAMDVSTNAHERSISYEDIHRSIVNAGNTFASKVSNADSNYVVPTENTANELAMPHPQQNFPSEPDLFYDINKPINTFTTLAETSSLTDSILSSDQTILNNNSNLVDHSLSGNTESAVSSMLNNISSSNSTKTNLSALTNNIQPDVIPNFLDHPDISATGMESENISMNMKVSNASSHFISGSLDSSSVSITNATVISEQLNSLPLSHGHAMFHSPLVLNSTMNPNVVPPSKVQPQYNVLSSNPSNITASNASPISLHIPLSQTESKPIESTLNLFQKPKAAPIPSSSAGMNQPIQPIMMTLEELQKLLSQQSLSQPSASQQLPQTLVLQKPTSFNPQLKKLNYVNSQPKLLIKGSTLTNQLRHIQPQAQQAREKLLIFQQTAPSQSRNAENASHDIQKSSAPFQLLITPKEQQHQTKKLPLLQPAHVFEHHQPKMSFQVKPSQGQASQNLVYQVVHSTDLNRTSDQHSRPNLPMSQKHLMATIPPQSAFNTVYLTKLQSDQQFFKTQLEQDKEDKTNQIGPDIAEKSDKHCSDTNKKEYKHLRSLLSGENTNTMNSATLPTQVAAPVMSLATNLQLPGGSSLSFSTGPSHLNKNFTSSMPPTSAPFSFLPLNTSLTLSPASSSPVLYPSSNKGSANSVMSNSLFSNNSSAPLSTLAFTNVFSTPVQSRTAENKDVNKSDVSLSNILILPQSSQVTLQTAVSTSDNFESEHGLEHPSHHTAVSNQVLSDRKRSHTPLSIDINSPNSNSAAPSPLSSPVTIEDGNTQATLIERSADLQIKSDTMQGMNDDDENASFFDINSFHKRPSKEENLTLGRSDDSVPMKILKGSLNTDARSSIQPSITSEQTFDIGSVVSTASNFTFAFTNKEDNSEVFTFGSGNPNLSATDTLKYKSGLKHARLAATKPSAKVQSMARTSVPTQQVRPVSRKQKDYSLKAYYPNKIENMELKILEQPEGNHRARYQTEGSRGAIKDASQQGFPIIKLFGYNKPTKLQVFIGDECGRVKPHGFYQACRVCGKNSIACTEQEIEGTTVIETDILPENDMTVKLDCIGILKLRNADVERRIGPKRARDKKKNNTRARLVLRTTVERSDGTSHVLQAVSNPIVCTQPIGQPEICRMSMTESSINGGDCLFIIGKNFKNKGTSVLFQQLDSNESVVWQAEAEIEQEYFQPTHLICKVPPFKDKLITQPEQVQIVVSCAGKLSDGQGFTYKPEGSLREFVTSEKDGISFSVYQVAQSIKQEVAMETNVTSSPKTLLSPESLHLNQMVLESSTTSSIFQPPPGNVSSLQSSPVQRPSPLSDLRFLQKGISASPATFTSPGAHVKYDLGSRVQSFLLEDKSDITAEPNDESMSQNVSSFPDAAQVTVHKNSETFSAGTSSYSVSRDSPMITSSNSRQIAQSSSLESALSSKPIVVVLDTGNLQSDPGNKIQQLLQQIIEAQNSNKQ